MKFRNHLRVFKYTLLTEYKRLLNNIRVKDFIEGAYEAEALVNGSPAMITVIITLVSDTTGTYKVVQRSRFIDEKNGATDLTEIFFGVYTALGIFLIDGVSRIPCFFVPEQKMVVIKNIEYIKKGNEK